jgi:hypothetical protein
LFICCFIYLFANLTLQIKINNLPAEWPKERSAFDEGVKSYTLEGRGGPEEGIFGTIAISADFLE